jgi:hypothetical protein
LDYVTTLNSDHLENRARPQRLPHAIDEVKKECQIQKKAVRSNVARQKWYGAFDANERRDRKSERKHKCGHAEFPEGTAVNKQNDARSQLSTG